MQFFYFSHSRNPDMIPCHCIKCCLKYTKLSAIVWKGKKCKLLHLMGNGKVVADAEVDCTDPQATVHHMSLGPDCWRVCVKKILVSKIPLYRATSEFMILEDAKD
ncbi:hypothetical protein ACOSQ4_007395 [Xanthoceras sorbifolium]